MAPGGPPAGGGEDALQAFLRSLPPAAAPRVRALAHAWAAADCTLQVGRMTVRLLAKPPAGPALELARVLLLSHGVAADDWTAWSDELAELQEHGFSAAAKYPTVRLDALPDPIAVRLAQGLRDLGRLAQGQPS